MKCPRHAGRFSEDLHDPFGSFLAEGSGHLDISRLRDYIRDRHQAEGSYRGESFAPEQLRRTPHAVQYRDWEARAVVFCEGWIASTNPFFQEIPWKAAKGEVLTVRLDSPLPSPLSEMILNCGKWLLPLGEGLYRTGATYGWDNLNGKPTPQGRRAILDALAAFLQRTVTVVEHNAGVRPITRDYRPVLGAHPRHPEIIIFNGMGSKGVLCGPWCAELLAQHLLQSKPLPPEVEVARYF